MFEQLHQTILAQYVDPIARTSTRLFRDGERNICLGTPPIGYGLGGSSSYWSPLA